MMDYSKGYSASFELRRVNPDTWTSGEAVDGLVSAQIERDSTDEYPLLETGSADIDMSVADSFEEGYYRLEMVAVQGSETVREPLATLLMSSGSSTLDRWVQVARVEGQSVLKPASDRLVLTGTYAPKGCDGAAYAAGLLRECTPAPVTAEGSFTLDEHAVFGVGISYLQAAWTVLKAAGWCIQIAGDGSITIRETPTEPAFLLDESARGRLMPGAERSFDLSEVPNRYFAVSGEEVGVAVNDLEGSRTSTVARGRFVDYVDDSPVKVNGETMAAYAKRKLSEMSTVTREWSYTREFDPGVWLYDLAAGVVPDFAMAGSFRVRRQSLACGTGITVSETLGEEVREYI